MLQLANARLRARLFLTAGNMNNLLENSRTPGDPSLTVGALIGAPTVRR